MPEEVIPALVGCEQVYAFRERTPVKGVLKPGDWLCFYANRKGVVAHAKDATAPVKMQHSKVLGMYP
jgi:hypothetical protein